MEQYQLVDPKEINEVTNDPIENDPIKKELKELKELKEKEDKF